MKNQQKFKHKTFAFLQKISYIRRKLYIMEILNFKGSLPDLIYMLKKGGSIHIKKKNRGKFTESSKRAGMGVQEYARHVLANKDKYSSTLVKRANFARNAKKFKHENGGILKYQNPSGTLPELIQRINKKSKANFVKRLLDPNRKYIQNWVNPLDIATHKLGWATEDTKQGAFVYPEIQEINGELVDFTHPSHRRSEGINSAIERRDTVRMTPEQAKWFTENYKQYYPGFKDGGILKAQEGTGNPYAPHPLSPIGIALNQAKAMAKTKEKQLQPQQQQLPPGVKEVIGLDGKKIAIRTEQPLIPLEQSIAEWLPGTGDVAEVGYIVDDVKNGNLGSAALAAGLTFIPGNWKKVLDTLTPSKKDKFVDFFSKEIGKTVKRVPVTKNDFQGIYSEGFRYLDESGKEIAHIAGSKYGDRVFVESSFMDPEFRSKGIGKQMYFDFNDQMFNKYGKTIGSDSGQHMMTLETSPGIFISPSGRMWRGLHHKGLATTENPPIVSYIMVEPKAIKSYKKYSKGSKL